VSEKKKGPTNAQLTATVKRHETTIAALRGQLARFKDGDALRREGEHWYELLDLMDPNQIREVPKSPIGRTFFMGMLNEITVLEYPASASPAEVRRFMRTLKESGVAPVLAVTEGVRFLRLSTVDAATEARLDDEAKVNSETSKRAGDESTDGGAGPELHLDGVGGGGPAGEEDHRRGDHPHGESEEGREADGSAG